MAELLLELLSEEIPARMQAQAAAQLERLVGERLKEARLEFTRAEAFVTPRRLALVVDGLPETQPDITVERKGPKTNAPEKAIQGFLKSVGLALDQCEQRETPKGTILFAVKHEKGLATAEVLAALLPDALGAMAWPKAMRWAGRGLRWVRPLHAMLCLLDGQAVPIRFEHLSAGATTPGHRFLAPDPIEVGDFSGYREKLRTANVMVDPAERQQVIRDEAARLAAAEGLSVKPDEALIAENAGMVEWPVVLMGRIDEAFMEVPPEVLISAMRTHQKYFSLLDKDGKLAPRFVMVANMVTADNGATIVAGNERVLRARLADAKFFWDQDRKQTLASRAPKLKEIVFHAKLGTLDDKMDRVQALAVALAEFVPGADKDRVRSAARLCKADLTTEMVGEFPELQGVMGRYYALNDGEHADVADAIAEHYAPLGPNDACPTRPNSVALALADKADTLFWFFAINEKPTGSKDPFALRRAALGIIRLVIENDVRLSLSQLFDLARENGSGDLARFSGLERTRRTQEVIDSLLEFFADRLKVHLREKGVRYDLISAVFARGDEDDLVRLLARVDALASFLGGEDGDHLHLLTAYKRAANILRIEEKKDGASYSGLPDTNLFEQDEESALHACIADVTGQASKAITAEAFEDAMASLATLRGPVDAFFDEVMVNSENPGLRRNRLLILSEIRGALDKVADFSKIEG
jgi:glycyl-tRNA synthetase beta chain